MESPWQTLVAEASSAPSPHNTQPWLVRPLSDTEAELYVPTERTLPHTDAAGAFMTNALGIFVEALDIAAGANGLTVVPECLFPKLGAGAEERPLFARLNLAERAEPPRFPVELLACRQTARGAYDGHAVDSDALRALESIADEGGQRLQFTSDPGLVDWMVRLNADTLFYDLDDDLTRAEIGRWVRRSEREASQTRDGFSPAALGFPGPLVTLFFFHHGLFATRPARTVVRRIFLRATRGTATVGWLQGPWSTPEDWFEAGRTFLRLWLELTRLGLYLQPFGSVITNPTAHRLMADKLAVDESGGETWLLLRIGHRAPPPRSFRRPVAELLA